MRGANHTPRAGRDFEDESPGNDAREEAMLLSLAPEVETHLVNAVLTNGARYYVDHAHPEFSTPEALDVREALVTIGPGRRSWRDPWRPPACCSPTARRSSSTRTTPTARAMLRQPRELPGRPGGPLRQARAPATTPLVTRQIFTGAGKIGSEAPGMRTDEVRSRSPSGPTLRGGGRSRDHPEAADRQHVRRAARRCPEVPAAPRHRRATPTSPRSPPS